jgi:hypothetical protein
MRCTWEVQRALAELLARQRTRGETVMLWDLVTEALEQWRERQEAAGIVRE